MAAPVVTKCTPDQVESIGSQYQETPKVVTDGATATATFTVGVETCMIGKILSVTGPGSYTIASDGRSVAVAGLPLSSVIYPVIRGLPGI